jgi:hypothetical protein
MTSRAGLTDTKEWAMPAAIMQVTYKIDQDLNIGDMACLEPLVAGQKEEDRMVRKQMTPSTECYKANVHIPMTSRAGLTDTKEWAMPAAIMQVTYKIDQDLNFGDMACLEPLVAGQKEEDRMVRKQMTPPAPTECYKANVHIPMTSRAGLTDTKEWAMPAAVMQVTYKIDQDLNFGDMACLEPLAAGQKEEDRMVRKQMTPPAATECYKANVFIPKTQRASVTAAGDWAIAYAGATSYELYEDLKMGDKACIDKSDPTKPEGFIKKYVEPVNPGVTDPMVCY